MWCKNADDGQIRELLIISTQAKRRASAAPASRSRRPGIVSQPYLRDTAP
jgi:hypothetical protein